MNSPDNPRARTMTGRIRRVGGLATRAFVAGFGVSSTAAWPSVSATAAPPLRRVPIITAPSRYAASGVARGRPVKLPSKRRGSRLDVGQVPPFDTGVEHRHGHHGDGAEVFEPRAEVDDAAAEDALGQADQDAAEEGDTERFEAA